MTRLFNTISLPQRIAIVCGGLCLVTALALVIVGNMSSRYILQQTIDQRGAELANLLATDLAPVLGNADLISLEVTLGQLAARHKLAALSVYDVDGRQISASGDTWNRAWPAFEAPIVIDDHLAGRVGIVQQPPPAIGEQRTMALGLFMLAALLALFASALSASWAQSIATRLRSAIEQLTLDTHDPGPDASDYELDLLEQRIAGLPLDLLKSPAVAPQTMADYESAGLLYVRLNSLASYAETLDEASLLRFTEFQRRLLSHAADLYAGQLTVARQFGLLLSFSGADPSGSPACRAASVAWLIREIAEELEGDIPFKLSLSLACAVSEAGTGSNSDIYPGLYCQHLVDELAEMTGGEGNHIALGEGMCEDDELQRRARIATDEPASLEGFSEPWLDLLERQRQILLRQLRN
jgi:hypothetical protein